MNNIDLIPELSLSLLKVILILNDHFFNFVKGGLRKKFERPNSRKFIPETFI
jgi:hypothetical protein